MKAAARMLIPAVFVLLLAGCADAEVSPQKPTRVPLSISPAGDAIYYCLKDKGWDVTIDWDGGVGASSETIPDAQKQLYLNDATECGQLVDDLQVNLTDAEKSTIYQAELRERDCLADLGYSVDEAPSLQTYLDTYSTEMWTAFGNSSAVTAAQGMSRKDFKKLSLACPQPQWLLGPDAP
jgi:hypothetical protein